MKQHWAVTLWVIARSPPYAGYPRISDVIIHAYYRPETCAHLNKLANLYNQLATTHQRMKTEL